MREKKCAIRMLSIVLCVCVLAGAVLSSGGLEALAGWRGTVHAVDINPKTEPLAALGSEENPFTVLEIVPAYEEAQIGYFFEGCGPVPMEKLKFDDTYQANFVNGSLKGIYDISTVTVYAFYDQIPEASELPVFAWSEQYRTRTDLTYAEADETYGVWREGVRNSDYEQRGYYEKLAHGGGDFVYLPSEGYQYVGGGQGEYIWVASEEGDSVRTPDGDLFAYSYVSYEHKNAFLRFVYELSGEEASDFKTQVITMIPADLQEHLELIDAADLITIHGASGDYEAVAVSYYGLNDNGHTGAVDSGAIPGFFDEGRDLTFEEVMRIVQRMASDHPAAMVLDKGNLFAMDDDPRKENARSREEKSEYNCHKLLYMLLSYQPEFFWKNFGGDLDAYQGADGTRKVEYAKGVKTGTYPPYRFWGMEYACPAWSDGKTSYETAMHPFLFLEEESGNATCLIDQIRYLNIGGGGSDVFEKIFTYDSSQQMLQFLTNGGNIKEKDMWSDGTVWNAGGITAEAFADVYRDEDSLNYLQIMDFILGGASPWVTEGQKLRILEIEPCNQFIYGSDGWKLYYQRMLGLYRPATDAGGSWLDDPKLLQVDTMPIWEFIGSTGTYDYRSTEGLTSYSSDDLISKYDLILFGSKQDASNGASGYRDPALKTYRYTSAGDLVFAGADNARYSAIDLTLKKVWELRDFVASGKPVVVDDELYKSDGSTVDTAEVDSRSKVYDFLTDRDVRDSIYVYNHIRGGQMKESLTESVCRLTLAENGYPTEYAADESQGILSENYHTSDTLQYVFSIVGPDTDTYTVSLNIDRNGDGVYDGSLKQLCEEASWNAFVSSDTYNKETTEHAIAEDSQLNLRDAAGAVKNGQLRANIQYTLSYKLPEGQTGILPWKLEVSCNRNEKLRSSVIDYTLIRGSADQSVRLNVLQMNLTPDLTQDRYDRSATYFTADAVDIGDGVYREGTGYTDRSKKLEDAGLDLNENQRETLRRFEEYLSPVNEFQVDIQFLLNKDWSALFGSDSDETRALENWKSFLEQYDILIFGFQDQALFTGNAVFREGLEDYIRQGKGVIFSHDMVQPLTNESGQEEAIGQDRAYQEANEWLRTVCGQRSVAYVPDGDGRYSKKPTTDESCDNAMQLALRAGAAYSGNTTSVKLANNGRITAYPYRIPDEIEVLQTHVQNYALNLECDREADVYVWCNLTDGRTAENAYANTACYAAKDNDCRNHFYLYSRGNVTYTGLGHGGPAGGADRALLTDDEIKLFINTLIGAYRQPEEGPFVVIENADAVTKSGTSAVFYLDYEGDQAQPVDGKVELIGDTAYLKVQFRAEDASFRADPDKTYYLYLEADGRPMQYAITVAGAQLASCPVKRSDRTIGVGYRLPGDRVSTGDLYTMYVPYSEIVDHNGQLSIAISTYAEYPKGNGAASTGYARAQATIVYLPLFELN